MVNVKTSYRPKVLIANRGEIAIRIARSAKRLGFPTVAVFSDADRFAEHVRYCDEAIYIGGSEPKASYLDASKVIAAALKTGAKLIHPGFGFLSERANFVDACEKAGLIFVGPTAESMRLMGDKITARRTVAAVGMEGVPGSPGVIKDSEEAIAISKKIGFPVLLKATAGGGGKGMRRVDQESDLKAAFEGASRESLGAFGDGSMYVEKYILEPHHVEVQVFGDGQGGAIHLGERECSIQRRHQKVWEESPAPILNQFPETRKLMFEAALRVTKHVKYAGAGTFEFIVDGKGNFYFLEMNTRLQVEHPVTEWVTGVDIVAWQLLLAIGEWKSTEIPNREGASIEVRFYAEDPHSFLPAPGRLGLIQMPSGPFLRSDTAFTEPGEVSVFYDPMIAKISVWGADRDEAVSRLRVALDEVRVEPPKLVSGERQGSLRTNLSFLRRLARDSRAISGDTTTDLIPSHPTLTSPLSTDLSEDAAIALSLFHLTTAHDHMGLTGSDLESTSVWAKVSREEGVRR